MTILEGKLAEAVLCLYRRGPSNVTDISKQTSSTYAHTVRVIEKLGGMGLVKFDRKGRTKIVELTELGRKIGKRLDEIENMLKLAVLSVEVEAVYRTEVKGKLREEINQERVMEKLAEISKQLEPLQSKQSMVELVLKLQARMEEIEREVKGLVVG